MKPATPLPWQANDRCIDTMGTEQPALATLCHGSPEQNADYIAHACNAYPKLVEALRNVMRSDKFKAAAEFDARLLLRELGEHDGR
jgi:hypothetical protein